MEEKGYDAAGRCLVEVDPRYFRPTEVDLLIGAPDKAREKLGWRHELRFEDLVAEMVAAELNEYETAPAEVIRLARRRSNG